MNGFYNAGVAASYRLNVDDYGILPQTAAALAAMNKAPDPTRVAILNHFLLGLIEAGIWAKLGWLVAMAAHDAQSGLVNLKEPATKLTAYNSPNFLADRGYKGQNTAYLSPNVSPGGVWQSPDDAHAGIWVVEPDTTQSNYDVGFISGTAHLRLSPLTGGAIDARVNSSVTATKAVSGGAATRLGDLVVSRSSSSAVDFFKDGTSLGATASTSETLNSGLISLLRTAGVYSFDRLAFFHLGKALATAEVSTFHGLKRAYLTAIGAL